MADAVVGVAAWSTAVVAVVTAGTAGTVGTAGTAGARGSGVLKIGAAEVALSQIQPSPAALLRQLNWGNCARADSGKVLRTSPVENISVMLAQRLRLLNGILGKIRYGQ